MQGGLPREQNEKEFNGKNVYYLGPLGPTAGQGGVETGLGRGRTSMLALGN